VKHPRAKYGGAYKNKAWPETFEERSSSPAADEFERVVRPANKMGAPDHARSELEEGAEVADVPDDQPTSPDR